LPNVPAEDTRPANEHLKCPNLAHLDANRRGNKNFQIDKDATSETRGDQLATSDVVQPVSSIDEGVSRKNVLTHRREDRPTRRNVVDQGGTGITAGA